MEVGVLFQSPVHAVSLLLPQLLAPIASLLHALVVLAAVYVTKPLPRVEATLSHLLGGLYASVGRSMPSYAVIIAVLLADTFGQLCLLVSDGLHLLLQSHFAFEAL